MKKKGIVVLVLFMAIVLSGCQTAARNMGGTTKLELPAGYKLMDVDWKDGANLWYLCRPMREGEVPEEYLYQESTEMGLLEGTVKITESEADNG